MPKSLSELLAFDVRSGHEIEQVVIFADEEISLTGYRKIDNELVLRITREIENVCYGVLQSGIKSDLAEEMILLFVKVRAKQRSKV